MLPLHRSLGLLCKTAVVLMPLAISGAAPAATITFTGNTVDLRGMGFGHVPPILTLQAHGREDSEWGFVAWDGAADVFSGADSQVQAGKSRSISAADLLAMGITRDEFALVFNINQAGDSNLVVREFSVDFYLADGTLSFVACYAPPAGGLSLYPAEQGQGRADWVFMVDLSPAEFDGFFIGAGNAGNRIGMTVARPNAIGNASGGAESFTVASIPEPVAALLLPLGLLFLRRRRR